ncbi:MAG: discoidin domain-containing protein [Oceanospirillum sp.]|nr:discoidin domain-containing protein [Oceanospirillum sp.]
MPEAKTAQATPADSAPGQSSAQPTPDNDAPAAKSPEATPTDVVPVERTAEASPSNAVPTARSAEATPANPVPSEIETSQEAAVSGLQAKDGVLGYGSSRPNAKPAPADEAPVVKQAEPTPEDSIPSQTAPEESPADAAPSARTPEVTPADALPTARTPESTPTDALPSLSTAEDTPTDDLPSETTPVATPANAVPVARTAESTPADATPSQKTAESTPADALPSQRTAQSSPSAVIPVQLPTATIPAVSGLQAKDGVLGHGSSRPVPKAESTYVPFTNPRIGYSSILDTGTVTVSAGSLAAAKNKLTYDKWQPATAVAWIQVDSGSEVEVDYAGIAAHTLVGVSVSLQYSGTGINWTTAATTTPTDTTAILFLLTAPVSARYWRLLFNGAAGYQVGSVMVGKALAVQRGINGGHSPVTLARNTVTKAAISERGEWLGRNIVRSGLSTDISLSNLDGDWYRENFDPFVESARTEPFFFAWNPQSHASEVALVWTNQDIAPRNNGKRNLMDVSLKVQGHA